MRAIDTVLEALTAISENDNQLPQTWLQQVDSYEAGDMGLAKVDLALLLHVIERTAPCKLLEIGAGNSTPLLFGRNKNGLNISLEDNPEWVEKVDSRLEYGSGTVISYSNEAVQHESVLPYRYDWKAQVKRIAGYSEEDLQVKDLRLLQKRVLIPDWLWSISFDIILVDGPFGGNWESHGRSGTTMLASKLSEPTGIIFIDDVPSRPHEMQNITTFFAGRYLYTSPSQRLIIAI